MAGCKGEAGGDACRKADRREGTEGAVAVCGLRHGFTGGGLLDCHFDGTVSNADYRFFHRSDVRHCRYLPLIYGRQHYTFKTAEKE